MHHLSRALATARIHDLHRDAAQRHTIRLARSVTPEPHMAAASRVPMASGRRWTSRRPFSPRSRPASASDHAEIAELTAREREVVVLVARGLTNAEIAETLQLSPLTARSHVSRILTKLGARDRVQLVLIAYQAGVVAR